MEMPDGVQAHLDDAFEDEASLDDGSSVSGLADRDVHRERYPKYVPPHLRGHSYEEGDEFVNFRDRAPSRGPDPDKVEGADNDKYQRLKLKVPFAVGFDLIKKVMKPQFPGWYFHSSGNANHDHPVSHMVTMIGTRLLQRRIKPGARVMDVYGNPYACERFNKSQAQASNPKVMTALVHNSCASDYIREVNKWGPLIGDDGPRYFQMSLRRAIEAGECDQFDTFQWIHTLYYEDLKNVKLALQTPSATGQAKRALCLIHRHDGTKGSINNGEQTYEVKRHSMFSGGLLKQVNVKTNTAYVHPNLTPMLFGETKEWYPSQTFPLEMRDRGAQGDDGIGLTWDLHMVNDDTWIVEMVLCKQELEETNNFVELWEEDKLLEEDYLSSTAVSDPVCSDRNWDNRLSWLPAIGREGIYTHLDLVSKPLFDRLRLSCAGKPRDRKLFAEMMKEGKQLIDPSGIFGDKDGVRCPKEKLVDHVVAAFLADYEKEGKLLQGMVVLKPLLRQHAEALKFGNNLASMNFANILDVIRNGLAVVRTVNKAVRSADVIDAGIAGLDNWISPEAN